MKKIAIVHAFLGTKTGSGSIYKCLKIIEALRGFYELSLITGNPEVDFHGLNNQWETKVRPDDIRIIRVPMLFLRRVPHFMGLRHAFVGRYCRAHAHEYDVMISAYNPYDFGVRGIQFIGDMIFSDKLRSIYHSMPKEREASWFYKDSWWRTLYLKAGRLLYNPGEGELWRNLTISNSRWTRDILHRAYGVKSVVIYPPVPDVDSRIPWDEKKEGFVTISNLVPFKKVERSIRIVHALRNQGVDVHLHIVGSVVDRVYASEIQKLCRENREWCFYEGPLYGRDKVAVIDEHKYGIHGAETEGFGIAAAEMIKTGSIVWVAGGGGQAEIVESGQLVFKDEEEAVSNILTVLMNKEKREEIRRHLGEKARDFALEKYYERIRRLVENFLNRKNADDGYILNASRTNPT